jgi:hypothetical protein
MLDPGSFIAIALASYSGAVKAWATFRAAAHFSEDADELVLKLGLERFRFETWGRNAGLEQNTFHQNLFPVLDLVTKILDRIRILFEDAETLRSRYGLVDDAKPDSGPRTTERFIARMQQSIRSTVMRLELSNRIEAECVKGKGQISAARKVYWGMRDKVKFQELVEDVEKYIEKLNQLLPESQMRSCAEDQARANIAIVGNIIDEKSLELIRKAIETGMQDHPISTLVERKALSDQRWNDRGSTDISHKTKLKTLLLKDFEIIGDSKLPKRCFARRAGCPGELFLFERKDHPLESSSSKEITVEKRVERLVLLLSRQREDLNTLHVIGYIADRANSCWWLVFRFPCHQQDTTTSLQPVSLLTLLNPGILKRKPALEQRFRLAYQLANTLSGLYSSSWMHKSLRSDNLLFPYTYDPKRPITQYGLDGLVSLSSPLLAGFEYSRQDNESQSLDALKHGDKSSIIYRHPLYQGEAASGYRVEYDIYSLGLILVEIAFWQSLATFLDARVTKSTSDAKRSLSSKSESFQQPDAEELQKRVLYRVDSELAFRVGTVYRDVVRWCLTMADESHARLVKNMRGDSIQDEEWHPALEFYNKVVVPLSQVARQGMDIE